LDVDLAICETFDFDAAQLQAQVAGHFLCQRLHAERRGRQSGSFPKQSASATLSGFPVQRLQGYTIPQAQRTGFAVPENSRSRVLGMFTAATGARYGAAPDAPDMNEPSQLMGASSTGFVVVLALPFPLRLPPPAALSEAAARNCAAMQRHVRHETRRQRADKKECWLSLRR